MRVYVYRCVSNMQSLRTRKFRKVKRQIIFQYCWTENTANILLNFIQMIVEWYTSFLI